MKVGIVGAEAAKFNSATQLVAKADLYNLIIQPEVTEVVSGGCHLGGIDIWAVGIAHDLEKKTEEFIPTRHEWSCYKARNIKIAEYSDVVYCLTVDKLPTDYDGMRFEYCYHCKTKEHVKSGGCWTVKYAKKLGKETHILTIKQR